jgi:hypothetical protein
MESRIIRAFAVLLLSALPGLLFAQADRATITGMVRDPSGAALTGVAVRAANTATGIVFTSHTNEVGIYTISGLPVGSYTIQMSQTGFKEYKRTDIQLSVAQVLQINAELTVGSIAESVTVTGAPPLLETQTSTTAMSMQEDAIRDLPLNAAGGRDALNLMLATVPTLTGTAQYPSYEVIMRVAGSQDHSSTIYIDGVEDTSAMQGDVSTPGLDALQEMQILSNSSTAELGNTGGGVVMYELKSGTNKFHGSAFEFLQNEALNANNYANNQFLTTCGSDPACQALYKRPRYRFNDYGFSAGGPIWKNHTFIFGDYERYKNIDDTLSLNQLTVPTPQMLSGDFSQLLTGGTQQGVIINPNTGSPWINPCTGLAYQYGQIFDPETQQQVGGVTCATPFPGNIIPGNRLSTVAQKVAAAYSQYYPPSVNRIFNNFPTNASANPDETKTNIDIRLDHNFSERNHLSISYDYMKFTGESVNGGFWYTLGSGPFDSGYVGEYPHSVYEITDNYSFTPHVLNTLSIGMSYAPLWQGPHPHVDQADYGFQAPGAIGSNQQFPSISFQGANGVNLTQIGMNWAIYVNTNGFHYQDTLAWQRGRHSFKFGGSFLASQVNTGANGSQTYNFVNDTGGPTDPGLNSYVGNGFANFMLGDVQSASSQVPAYSYPRQKYLHLFAQDDMKVNPKLTLNLGILWDYTFRGHEQAGRWTNFDVTAQNPLWAPYDGAWTFTNNSGDSFETNEFHHQFGPHIGAAYQLTGKLVARGGYGLSYVPLGALNVSQGPYYPSSQNYFFFGNNTVPNTIQGAIAFNLDEGYPGQTVNLPRTITQTAVVPNNPDYTSPDFLRLGHMQDWDLGVQYEVARDILLDLRYMANRGGGLHDPSLAGYENYADWNTYQKVLLAGNINATVSDPTSAAAAGVPYPYPGFVGPAYAAISPFPQLAANGQIVMPFDRSGEAGVSAFNAFVAEVKTRRAHGFNVDFSYTLSKSTGSVLSGSNYASTWQYAYQNFDDLAASKNWVQGIDQTHLAKGYVTYDLPFGRNRKFLNSSGSLDRVVGGWTLGYYGSYGSGSPMPEVPSTVQVPYFYGSWGTSAIRENFANGANANNITNHFGGHLDLVNQSDPSNNAFNTNLFANPALGSFGNTPYIYDHWRWNPGVANENMSLIKHFRFGQEGQYQASIRAEFYNVFNRHYFGAPDTNASDVTFGQVTSVWGNRSGQLGARFQW